MSVANDYNNALNQLGKYGSFSYNSIFDDKYNNAKNSYDDIINNPSKYGYNSHITDVNDLFEQIMNQEKFSYDTKKDALFQMYKKQYEAQGKRSMQNQMGVAAAMSGGYNSSVAQTSAQKQFQNSMDELSKKAAETYQNSLDMYKYKQQNLLNRYNTARDMNNAGNEAYWKQVDVATNNMNNAYNAWQDDRNFQYNSWNDGRTYWAGRADAAQGQVNWEKEYNQTENWNKKNYELQKKIYKGK